MIGPLSKVMVPSIRAVKSNIDWTLQLFLVIYKTPELSSVTLLVSLGCVIDNKAQGDENPWTNQSQEAHHGPLDQHVAA